MRFLLAIVLSFACAPLAFSQPPQPAPSIRANGEATVSERPNQVQIHVGVVTQAATAQAAAEQNGRQLTQALNDLCGAAGPGAAVRTINYSLTPNHRFPRDGGTPTITGYTATNIVEVRLSDVAAAGKVIDAATRSGANTIQSVQYLLKDEQAVRERALREATLQARANAGAMAGALNLRLGNALSIEQGEPTVVRPMMQAMRANMAPEGAVPTPMSPGTIDVHASVTLIVAILQ